MKGEVDTVNDAFSLRFTIKAHLTYTGHTGKSKQSHGSVVINFHPLFLHDQKRKLLDWQNDYWTLWCVWGTGSRWIYFHRYCQISKDSSGQRYHLPNWKKAQHYFTQAHKNMKSLSNSYLQSQDFETTHALFVQWFNPQLTEKYPHLVLPEMLSLQSDLQNIYAVTLWLVIRKKAYYAVCICMFPKTHMRLCVHVGAFNQKVLVVYFQHSVSFVSMQSCLLRRRRSLAGRFCSVRSS